MKFIKPEHELKFIIFIPRRMYHQILQIKWLLYEIPSEHPKTHQIDNYSQEKTLIKKTKTSFFYGFPFKNDM